MLCYLMQNEDWKHELETGNLIRIVGMYMTKTKTFYQLYRIRIGPELPTRKYQVEVAPTAFLVF